MCAHLLLREIQNCNSRLNNHQQENVGFHQKKIPHIQGQRSPNKMVGGPKSCLESNPVPTRDARRAQTKPCVHQDPEATQRLSQTCLWVFQWLLWRHRSAVACHGARGSSCSRPGSQRVWHKPSWRRLPLTHHRAVKQTTHKLQNNNTKEILTLLRKF